MLHRVLLKFQLNFLDFLAKKTAFHKKKDILNEKSAYFVIQNSTEKNEINLRKPEKQLF